MKKAIGVLLLMIWSAGLFPSYQWHREQTIRKWRSHELSYWREKKWTYMDRWEACFAAAIWPVSVTFRSWNPDPFATAPW